MKKARSSSKLRRDGEATKSSPGEGVRALSRSGQSVGPVSTPGDSVGGASSPGEGVRGVSSLGEGVRAVSPVGEIARAVISVGEGTREANGSPPEGVTAPVKPTPPADPPGSVTIRNPVGVSRSSRPTGPNVTGYWIPAVSEDAGRDAPAPGNVVLAPPSGPAPPMALPIVTISVPSSPPGQNAAAVSISSQPGRPASATPMRAATMGVPDGASAARTTAGAPSPEAPPAAASNPFRVGPYEVALRIARGGTGSVYVCRKQSEPSRLLTLKVIRQHAPEPELAAAALKHEALIGSLFHHANAHTALQSGVYEGQPYVILDYVEGGCFADLLTEESRPTPAIAVAIVLDVLAALQALHHATDSTGKPLGLIHCDVSPDNVLIGINGVCQLADFGSARITAHAKEAQPFALTKPPYMAPEQFRGEDLDARADIYSAGVLLWTALTGQQPFAADSYDQIAVNVMRKMVKPPSAYGAPACLDEVCMQAMSRSPERRFVIADAMAAALHEVARTQNLIEPHEGVGRWLRTAMGDELAQRRRQIDSMFFGGGRPVAAPRQDGAARASRAASAGVRGPSPFMTPAHGEKAVQARAGSGTERGAKRRRPRLTPTQQAIIAVASGMAFASTIAVGLALMPRPSPRPRPARPVASAAGAPRVPRPPPPGTTVGQGAR